MNNIEHRKKESLQTRSGIKRRN